MQKKLENYKLFYKDNLSEVSIYIYHGVLLRFFKWHKNSENITENDLRKYIDLIKESGKTSSSVVGFVSAIKSYIEFVNKTNSKIIISPIIFQNILVPKIKTKRRQPVILYNKVRLIFNSIEKRYRHEFSVLQAKTLIMLYITTGARRHEIENLNIDDIDLDNNIVYLYKTKRDKPKVCLIAPTAKKYILEYFKIREKYNIENKYFLTSYRHNSNIEYCGNKAHSITNYLAMQIKKDIKDFNFHSLRRGFATDLANSGVSIYDISQLLGHESINTTLKCYVIRDNRICEAAKNHPAYKI